MRPLPRPEGLLLDFGGVIVQTRTVPEWYARLASHLLAEMATMSIPTDRLTQASIEADLRAAAQADSRWKDAMSRPFAPKELGYEEFWGDFVAADWPTAARRFTRERAAALCRKMGELRQTRDIRSGMTDLLDAAGRASVPVGVVSNTLSGVVHRDYLHAIGLGDRFAAQIYSDEVSVRKPNPLMILLGARAIGVPVDRCWYVGDNFDRDVVCGARAGVGGNILMESPDTHQPPYEPTLSPDAVVRDPDALLQLFSAAVRSGGPRRAPAR